MGKPIFSGFLSRSLRVLCGERFLAVVIRCYPLFPGANAVFSLLQLHSLQLLSKLENSNRFTRINADGRGSTSLFSLRPLGCFWFFRSLSKAFLLNRDAAKDCTGQVLCFRSAFIGVYLRPVCFRHVWIKLNGFDC